MHGGKARAGAVAALVAAACAASPKHPGYEDAARAARQNFQSAAGARYARLVERHVGSDFFEVARLCYERIPDARGATLLFRLDPSGNALETIAYPDGELAACLLEDLEVFPLPAPPEADYWIRFGVPARSELPSFWGGG